KTAPTLARGFEQQSQSQGCEATGSPKSSSGRAWSGESQQLARYSVSALGIAILATGTKILGFVETQVLAYRYGLGSEVEAYLVATTLAMAIFVLIRELLEPSFLP